MGLYIFYFDREKYFCTHFALNQHEEALKLLKATTSYLLLHLFGEVDADFGKALWGECDRYLAENAPVVDSGGGGVAFLYAADEGAVELYVELPG